MLHEVDEAAVVLEHVLVDRLLALVDELDLEARVQERQLAEPVRQLRTPELDLLGEDLGVGPEADRRAGLLGGLALDQLGRGAPARVAPGSTRSRRAATSAVILAESAFTTDTPTPWSPPEMLYPPPPNFPPAFRVVSATSTAGRRSFAFGIGLTGIPAPSSWTDDAVVRVDRDDDLGGAAGHRLVHGVVDDLVDEVVHPARAGGADVHPRAEPDVLDALEDLDVMCVVGVCSSPSRWPIVLPSVPRAGRPTHRSWGRARGRRTNPSILPIGGDANGVSSRGNRPSTCGFARRSGPR